MTTQATSEMPMTGASTVRCLNCGAEFQALTLFGRVVGGCCSDACLEAVKAKLFPAPAPVTDSSRAAEWRRRCPPRYCAFEADKLPARGKAVLSQVLAWSPTGDRGLALVGESNGGKSMLLHEVARKVFEAGHDVHVTGCTDFAYSVSSGDNAERRTTIDRCCNCEILLMDDVGKAKMTDRVEADFYHILEHREKWQKLVLFTCNSRGSVLADGMTDDRAEPIVNRLRRLAEVVAV